MRTEKIGRLILKFRRKKKVPKSEYRLAGNTPIIDQSSDSDVAGYTDDLDARHEFPLPVTIFGDHTRVVKFARVPFASGADGTQLLYPKSDEIDPTYFYYAVKNIDLSNYFYARHFKFLKEEKISLPLKPIQTRIATILSTYDDAIENNRRRMALLEKSARLLYEEWFVRLRFPGHEHTPVKDGLPKGWEQRPLSAITSYLQRGIAPRYNEDAPGLVINQKCIRNGRLNLNLARHQSREFSAERQVHLGDVLVNSTGEGTLGRVAQVRTVIENCTVDTHVTIVRPKEEIPIHYFGMAVMAWETRFSTMGRGATNQTELSQTAIGEAAIVLPSMKVLNEFEKYVAPINSQISNLALQNDKLRASRDLLLPRLMSGEIEV
jgi:restriction endonuclease S subunit